MRYVIAGVLAVVLTLLAGCETRMPSASGLPEVTVHGCSPSVVKNALVADMADKGAILQRSDDIMVVFEKKGDFGASLWLGTAIQPNAFWRIKTTIIGMAQGTRVIMAPYLVSNRGNAWETEYENWGSFKQIQSYLDSMAARLEWDSGHARAKGAATSSPATGPAAWATGGENYH